MPSPYEQNVLINCPFDSDFRFILEAIIFTVHDCRFVVRSALEADDGSQVRISKIYGIIADCRFGVHDLSRTELDPASFLPRFNMPLELGIFGLTFRSFATSSPGMRRTSSSTTTRR